MCHPAPVNTKQSTYAALKGRVRALQEQGQLSKKLSREEMVDWAFGNTVIENPDVTLEMVETAYDTNPRRQR
jgi:hypothetical protein